MVDIILGTIHSSVLDSVGTMSEHDSHPPTDSQAPADAQQAYSMEVPGIPPHSHTSDVEINTAIATALGERKLKFTDRRLLIIYLVIVLVGLYVLHHGNTQSDSLKNVLSKLNTQETQLHTEQQRFEQATTLTCTVLNGVVMKYDSFLLSNRDTTASRTDLPANVKLQVVKNYNDAIINPLNCVAISKAAKK